MFVFGRVHRGYRPPPGIGPFPNTDLDSLLFLQQIADLMPEVTPKNPPIYPGRRFASREYALGLSLRDSVASDVLAYMINDASCVSVHQNNSINRELAQKAFAMADAFLEERNRDV